MPPPIRETISPGFKQMTNFSNVCVKFYFINKPKWTFWNQSEHLETKVNILKSKWTFWNQSEHFEIKVEIFSKTYWIIRLKIGLLRSVYYTFAYYIVLKIFAFRTICWTKKVHNICCCKSKWKFWNQSERFEIKVNVLKLK